MKAAKGTKIGIVKSVYNPEITDALLKSCMDELAKSGVNGKNIKVIEVPGAFEIPYACQKMALEKKYDAIIALGAIIRGDTPHFKYIAKACANGIMDVSLKMNIPVIFGVLTTENIKQAKDRIRGGKCGDKGVEATQSALNVITNNK